MAFALVAAGLRTGAVDWAVVVDAVLLAAAGTFAFRLLVLVAVSEPPLIDRVVPAAVQPVSTAAVVAAIASGTGLAPVITVDLSVAAFAAVLYGGMVVGLVAIVDYPLGRQWGLSGFEFLHRFIEYLDGRANDLELLLAGLGRQVDVPVSVLSIRGTDGAEKARVVVPLAHPGPLAGVGGGRLPYRLAEDAEGVAFTPHGLAGYAHDPATRRDVDALCAAAADAAEQVTYEAAATPPVRERAGDATVRGQRFGDGSLLVSTFAPATTDDVDWEVGIEARAATGCRGEPLLTDTHNVRRTDAVDDGLTTPGSARSDALVADAAADAVADPEPARAGTASETATTTIIGADAVDDVAAFTDYILPRCGAFVLGASLLVTLAGVALFWASH